MDKIRAYVDAMFSSLPNTQAAAEMKQNILENMQEHYEELIAQGMSENEALGTVIAQFGSIDEIKRALGVDNNVAGDFNIPVVNPAIAAEYEQYEKSKPVLIAVGVILLILSPLAYMFGSTVTGWFGSWISDLFGELLLFLFVAAGVGLFVWTHLKESYYRKKMNLPPDEPKPFDNITENDYRRMGRGRFAGIVYLCATILFLFFGFTIHWWHPGWMIFLVAAAVVAFYPGRR